MNFNWEAIAAVGEILGGVGVIATLVYLAIQIRQNTKASRAATAQQMTDRWVAINLQMSQRTTSGEVSSLAGLPQGEYQSRLAFWRALFHQWSNNHYQHSQGVLDDALFVPTGREIALIASSPNVGSVLREAWKAARHVYNDDFAQYMDVLLDQNPIVATSEGDS